MALFLSLSGFHATECAFCEPNGAMLNVAVIVFGSTLVSPLVTLTAKLLFDGT